MKKLIILGVVFIATFAVSIKLHSSSKSVTPTNYCAYDKDKDMCEKRTDGTACYLVDEDCSWIN